MSSTHVALIRGINVGRASRVAMADLRAALSDLGYEGVRTVLNSGNVLLDAPGEDAGSIAAAIERVLAGDLDVPASVIVLTVEAFEQAVAANPLAAVATDPSRLMFAFLADPSDAARLEPLLGEDWAPEVLATGRGVAYLWCPNGVIASRLVQAVGRELGKSMTVRNAQTVARIVALLEAERGSRP